MYYVIFVGITITQLILLNRYYDIIFRVSPRSRKSNFIIYLLAGGILYVSLTSLSFTTIMGNLSFISTLIIAFIYPVRIERKIIFSILYLILELIAESLSYYYIAVFHQKQTDIELSSDVFNFFIILCSTFIQLLFIKVIGFIKKVYNYRIGIYYYLNIVLIFIISLFILNTLFHHVENDILYVLSGCGILTIDIIIVFLYDKMIEKVRLVNEKHQLQKQIELRDNSYVRTKHSFKRIKRIIHDTKKQLVYIRACIMEQQFEEAITNINTTLEDINSAYLRIATGNLVIDALVSHALNIANDKGMDFKHDISINSEDIRLDRYDLCVVIGNILDNAIEAVDLVSEKEERSIHLQIWSDAHSLFIHVTNTCLKPTGITKKLHLEDDFDFHGIGLVNIQRIVEKYEGFFQSSRSNHHFETMVMLPFNENNSKTMHVD
ncbi:MULTISPECIES: sensor histidine kinase [unclassified Paenibacillus]|uniref:sensor histidine kinase n=1 Tax=unclassified Paenibacillus TaxID=185978 RepID=UPI0020B88128|nr:sensor histidine kinase [Paenibacillus sp. CH40]MCP3795515.1 GHKL domain-containing protein [Paenibacillus sp. CH40]